MESPEQVTEELRSQSPLPVMAALLVTAVLLALAVNILSSAIYGMVESWIQDTRAESAGRAMLWFNGILAVLCFLLLVVFVWYAYWLSRRTQPQVQHILTLLLPFRSNNGEIRFVEIPRLRAHRKLDEMGLQLAVQRGRKSDTGLDWHGSWQLPHYGDGTPVQGDGVTILYDLVEWMVIREIAQYGRHVYAGKNNLRPGDDFDDMPTDMIEVLPSDLYRIFRPNYVWFHSIHRDKLRLKVPAGTEIRLQELPMRYGVEAYGKELIRQIVVKNPAGSLTIRPSQIWRQATSNRARSLVQKQFPDWDVYLVEIKLMTVVRLSQLPFVWPWANRHTAAYQRWLLELQEQIIRHMDWERYVEADYRRMLVDVRDTLIGSEDE